MADVETLETFAGERLFDVCDRAVVRADQRRSPVRIAFNGVAVIVQPGRHASSVEIEVHRLMDANAAAYRASPAGRKATADAQARLDSCQHEHDTLTSMPIATLSEAALMDWLARYTDAADHIGVKGRDTAAVADALEAAGYKPGDACGLPEADYLNPRTMARYVVGQAIDCLRSGMGPHPVTHKFIDEYRRLSSAAA